MAATVHFVVPFDSDDGGRSMPLAPIDAQSKEAARLRAEALATRHVGAIACSCRGDPGTGIWENPVVLAIFGEVDPTMLDGSMSPRGGAGSRA